MKASHINHPSNIWARETSSNYMCLWKIYMSTLAEYTHRYGKIHGASKHEHILSCTWAIDSIPYGKQTKHPQCFSGLDELKTDEFYPIKAYRAFHRQISIFKSFVISLTSDKTLSLSEDKYTTT